MDETKSLILRNLLNGIEPEQVAQAVHLSPAEVQSILTDALARVRQHRLVSGYPFFPCDTLAQARQNRLKVLAVIEKIKDWDNPVKYRNIRTGNWLPG